MSGNLEILSLKEEDVTKMLSATTHIGSDNVDFQMEQYVYKRRADGVHIINLRHTWEKLLLAARAIAAIDPPSEVFVISSKPYGQRAVLKFAAHTGATAIAGRFTPGAFTNQIQKAFREPRLLVVTDPHNDHQPITEASYVNIPVIAFCNTDSPLRYVDIAIPCNNKAIHSIGLMWWLLAREVTRFKGRESQWNVVVDLFFFRDPDEAEKEEAVVKEVVAPKPAEPTEYAPVTDSWAEDPVPAVKQWADDAGGPPAPAGAPDVKITEEWATQADTAPAVNNDWGASAASSSWK